MSVCSGVADYRWLTGGEAAGLLDELVASDAPLHSAIGRLRGRLTADQTHLLVEQVELRRRARAKFSAADRMFFTRLGLQQSTDEHVARYKASRLLSQRAGASSPPVLADLCCGIGGDMLALATVGQVVGVDCDPAVAHFARHNADTVLDHEYAARVSIECADAGHFKIVGVGAWHIDPDRRASGRRTTSLDFSEPSLQTLERLLAALPHAAIKLAPATEVPSDWAERCELEWISRGGECRQLVAWHGELARAPGQHRATIVGEHGLVMRTITGHAAQPLPLTNRMDRFIFDVDPAVSAARLTGALVAEFSLSALSAGATYLTGPAQVLDPAISCFEVDEVVPMRVRTLAKFLRDRRVGELEIKKRGVDVLPEKLRQDLKLRGENAATLLITPVANRPTAILAHRVTS